MISEFYYGTSWKWPIQVMPRVMLSANVVRNMKSTWKMPELWMMDSGIGSLFKNGTRTLTIEKYKEILNKWNPPIAWAYDWPCEPSIRESLKYSVKEAQSMTTQNTIEMIDDYPIYPVIQGWKLSDYLDHIDQIKAHGLIKERMGIGSICRRGSQADIIRIIKAIRSDLPSYVKLHGFGIKIAVLKGEGRFLLFSADSTSWDIERRYYEWTTESQRGLTWQEKIPRLEEYITKIESMLNPIEPLYMNLKEER